MPNTQANSDLNYALFDALYRESPDIDYIKLLISKGADVNARNSDKRTPLHTAAYNGKKMVAALLIKQGADINAKDVNGQTPRDVANNNDKFEAAEFLISEGADVDIKVLDFCHSQTIQKLLDNSIKTINKISSNSSDLNESSIYTHFAKTAQRFCSDTELSVKDKVQIYLATRAVQDFLSKKIDATEYQQVIKGIKTFHGSWVKLMLQAMLAIFFVGLLVASTAVAMASCGVAIPFVAALGMVVAKAGTAGVASTVVGSAVSLYGSHICTKFALYNVNKNQFANSAKAVSEKIAAARPVGKMNQMSASRASTSDDDKQNNLPTPSKSDVVNLAESVSTPVVKMNQMSVSRTTTSDVGNQNNLPTSSNSNMVSLADSVSSLSLNPQATLTTPSFFAQTAREAEEDKLFNRLLSTAINAEPVSYEQEDMTQLAAIAILKEHPELLFRVGRVKDHFDRTIEGSPYQLFLGAEDVWALKQVHDEIIPKIENGEAIAAAQFKAQFPNCPLPYTPDMSEEVFYDDRNKKQIEEVKDQLKAIVEDLKKGFRMVTLVQVLRHAAGFHKYESRDDDKYFNHHKGLFNKLEPLNRILKPRENEVIKTGLHFPQAIMSKMIEEYLDLIECYRGRHSSIQEVRDFFSCLVIGKAQRALTSVRGQVLKMGDPEYSLKRKPEMTMANGPDRRDGIFCDHPKYVPVELAPIRDKLGHTMFVDMYEGAVCVPATMRFLKITMTDPSPYFMASAPSFLSEGRRFSRFTAKGHTPPLVIFQGAIESNALRSRWEEFQKRSRGGWEYLCNLVQRERLTSVTMPAHR